MEDFQIKNIKSNNIDYNDNDTSLLSPISIKNNFGEKNDIVEFHLYDSNNNILLSDYNHKNIIKLEKNSDNLFEKIQVNPIQDINKLGYTYGEYFITYNFFTNILLSNNNNPFYISEISPSRTEIKISSLDIEYQELQNSFIEYIVTKNNRNYYSDFILNFGNNRYVIGVNIELDINEEIPSLYIKLYEPLPNDIGIKNTLWLNEVLNESYNFNLYKDFTEEITDDIIKLRKPNFTIDINNRISSPTPYLNISNILDNNNTSSLNHIESLINDNININIDYTSFSNFIHFSSAEERIRNFVYKLDQIQTMQRDIEVLNQIPSSSSSPLSSSIINLNNKIDNIIQNFDHYDRFLYYESSSYAYPKSGSTILPLSHPTSSQWLGSTDNTSQYYGGILLSSSLYDNTNKNYLYNNLPEYIKEDPQNDNIKLFTSMWGHYFDYLWIYVKDITNKLNADNRIDIGISKDLITETLNSYGINLYNNSRNNDDIYESILGTNTINTGSYYIENVISSSNEPFPYNNINGEIYKRLYHNLPYILKTKGTNRGLKSIINCFGIPETILKTREFGGNFFTGSFIENINHKFNYKLHLDNSNSISFKYQPFSSSNIFPSTIEFRFKPTEISSSQYIIEESNNLFRIEAYNTTGSNYDIRLGISGSYGWDYTENIQIPSYSKEWINFVITQDDNNSLDSTRNNTYYLYIGYKTKTNQKHIYTSSLYIDGSISSSYNNSFSTSGTLLFNGTQTPFYSGSIQEFRYWDNKLSIEDFSIHVNNPKSFYYNNTTGSYNNLKIRFPLGSELNNDSSNLIWHNISNTENIFPGVNNSDIYSIKGTPSFEYNYEDHLIENPNIGTSTETNEKINIINDELIPGDTLSPFISIRKTAKRGENIYDSEIGISPIYSIDDDIIKQLGDFNIGDYIGDPTEYSSTSYEELNKLKLFYFKKYLRTQDNNDIIKLLSYIDNSLFKIIKDFTPAKSNISTGLIIKSHILERNKISRFRPNITTQEISESILIPSMSGNNPSDYTGKNINDRYINYISGSIGYIQDDNIEFYNGDFKGSNLIAYYPSLNNIIYEYSIININENNLNDVLYFNIPLNPIEYNISSSRESNNKYNLDYSTNINIPTNLNIISNSLFNNEYNNIIQGEIQDSNYELKRHINPRYNGSKLIAQKFNEYNEGDISYGIEPVLNLYKTKFAYFEEITSQSLTLPERSNVYIKYLIDENSNITELSRQNTNIIDIQDIFNINKADIILDNNQSPSNQVTLDGLSDIFSGGFIYKPILQNLSTNTTTHNKIDFLYEDNIEILNIDGISLIENLPINSVILGDISLNSNPIASPPLGTPGTIITAITDSKLKIPITRNTPYQGEIRVRISGSIILRNTIKTPNNLIGTLWNVANNRSGDFEIPVDLQNPNNLSQLYNWGWTPQDNIRYAKIPVGATAYFYNNGSTTITTTLVGNGVKTQINFLTSYGVDFIRVELNSVSASISTPGLYNNMGNIPDVSGLSGVLPVSGSEGLNVDLEYPIDGFIILPENVQQGEVIIKNSQNIDGRIRAQVTALIISSSPAQLNFEELPNIYSNDIFIQNTPFYYTEPPEFLYISGSVDNGYNSGSASDENWYFERANSLESGSFFNKLVASYDFSNILYEINTNENNIIQLLDPLSSVGFENINDFFIPKIGDLVRLYNHDRNEFFIPFESEIKNITYPTLPPDENSYNNRFIIELSKEIPNQACLDYSISGSSAKQIQNYIFLSKEKDETNVIINKTKNEGNTSSGIIIPNTIDPNIKSKIGNIIKQLKNQNLI